MSTESAKFCDLIHAPFESLLGSWMESINRLMTELRTHYPLSQWLTIDELDQNQLIDGLNRYLIHDRLETLDYLDLVFIQRSRTRFLGLRLTRSITGDTYHDRWMVIFGDEHYGAIGRISDSVAFTGNLRPRRNALLRAIHDFQCECAAAEAAEKKLQQKAERAARQAERAARREKQATKTACPPKIRPIPATPATRTLRHINQIVHGLPPEIATPLRQYLLNEYLLPLTANSLS